MEGRHLQVELRDDFLIAHDLEEPSLTVQWLPIHVDPPEGNYCLQQMVVGTRNLGDEPNYLVVIELRLPVEGDKSDAWDPQVVVRRRMNHDGIVNRARYMPQNPFLIATKSGNGLAYIFNHLNPPAPEAPPGSASCIRLRGHSAEGSGLSWNMIMAGHLLSGSLDGLICLWNVNATATDNFLDPIQTFQARQPVRDVGWHFQDHNLFGSVGDDQHLLIWDTRSPLWPVQSSHAHRHPITCLSFNPSDESLVATGSVDRTVKIFDRKKIDKPLWTFENHGIEVTQLDWNPNDSKVLASSDAAGRLFVWDLGGPGEEPHLETEYASHRGRISDFSWNRRRSWTVASLANDVVHISQKSQELLLLLDDIFGDV